MDIKTAIKELKKLQTECIYEEGCQSLNIAIKTLKKQQWIPVNKKLPKKGSHVLACFDDGFVTGVSYEEDWELWADSGEVIAWMPLPEPYKEDK